MWLLLPTLLGLAGGVGIGTGVRLIAPPAPALPLGVTSIQDSGRAASDTAAAPAVEIEVEGVWKIYTETVLKVVGTASNIVLQLSPMRLVTEIRMTKSVSGISPAPLLALTACGYQWSFYGYFAFSITENVGFLTLVYANILGLVLGMYYLVTYYVHSEQTTSVSYGLAAMVAFAAETTYCFLDQDISRSLFFAGTLSAILSIIVSFSPMVSLKTAITEKSLVSVPVDIIIASFVSCLVWTLLGLLLHDPWVLIPNSIGLLLGCIQLGAIAYITADPGAWSHKVNSFASTFARVRNLAWKKIEEKNLWSSGCF